MKKLLPKFEFQTAIDKSIISEISLNSSSKFKLESLVKETDAKNAFTKNALSVLPELSHPVIGKFSGIFAKLDSMSVNKRFYSAKFWRTVLDSDRVQQDLALGRMLGIFEHPNVPTNYTEDGLFTARHPINAAFVVKRLWIEGNNVMGEGYILNTALGKLLATYFLAKDDQNRPLIQLFISARGYSQNDYFDQEGIDQMNSSDYLLQSFDVVIIPGIKGASVKMESQETPTQMIAKLESYSMEVASVYAEHSRLQNELRLELGLKTV